MSLARAAEHDLREGGEWTRTQTLKNDVLWASARGAIAALGALPASWLRPLGRGVGALAYVLFGAARRTAHANLALAFPELDARERGRLVRRAYDALGACLGETVGLLRESAPAPPLLLDAPSLEALAGAHAEGRGVLFASAHLGPWERVAGALVAAGLPLTTIARDAYDPRFTLLYERIRARQGVRTIYRGAPGAAARIVRTLKGGGVLGVPMDLRTRVTSIDAPFLGHLAATPVGPARLALRTGAAVVVGTSARAANGDFCVTATRIAVSDLDRSADAERALTTRINDELSARIRALPDGWVWMHPRFAR
jgi:KDO2-lipid IV(A) lauroyltransferase